MTRAHAGSVANPVPTGPPGPNQWLKDHLDSVIDAQLLAGVSAADTGGIPPEVRSTR
ncbi:hypothetical protein [Streptomyces sp. NPDC057702]|uniref:hypothetical protein n=1 Tax=unclassified Streptomyces TaxID=2593676 RepID=UPI003689E40A